IVTVWVNWTYRGITYNKSVKLFHNSSLFLVMPDTNVSISWNMVLIAHLLDFMEMTIIYYY
ncbi:MAG: hypothetical protein QW292_09245, partial [Candidatus Parvarchaeota archaeon]